MDNSTVAAQRLGVDEYATLVGARLIDFFNESSLWQRRLWDIGTCMLLDELIEAVDWRDKSVLSSGALTWLARDAERIIGRDPAAGDRIVKTQLRDAMRTSLTPGTRHVRSLRQLSTLIQTGYLTRWANQIERRPAPERLARAIAAHLLDRGYSMPFLHRWARSNFRSQSSLAAVMDSAIALSDEGMRTYEVMLPFLSVPGAKTPLTESDQAWRQASEIHAWLQANAGDPRAVRQSGGFVYTFEAQDPVSAAHLGARNIERILSRSTLANPNARLPTPEGRIWVAGESSPIRVPQRTRNALVRSLVAESRLYDLHRGTDLDDALELLAAMNTGSPGPAIASGWAAIESLLVSPTDPQDSLDGRGAIAADRVAALVASSWPRGDLTTLSYRHKPDPPDLVSQKLAQATSNRERSRIIGDSLTAGRSLALTDPSDKAAAARMSKLMSDPRATLRDVESHVRSAMRRLYRQRNIVMHGGSTGTLTLESTLRTCAPLVGAALDRITHARLADEVDALQLSTRAQLGFELLAGDVPIHVVDLLE